MLKRPEKGSPSNLNNNSDGAAHKEAILAARVTRHITLCHIALNMVEC